MIGYRVNIDYRGDLTTETTEVFTERHGAFILQRSLKGNFYP